MTQRTNAGLTNQLLVIDLGTRRRPDLWLLSTAHFTAAEIAPYQKQMKKLRLRTLAPGEACRWGKLFSKTEVLAFITTKQQTKEQKS